MSILCVFVQSEVNQHYGGHFAPPGEVSDPGPVSTAIPQAFQGQENLTETGQS